jgi:hypothetical protein
VPHHVALPREEAAAVGALVVAPLLVHRARVPVTVARRLELGGAVWIRKRWAPDSCADRESI